MNATGAVDVNLTFKMRSDGELLKAGSWFSFHQLEAAHPFDFGAMKAYTNYKTFSLTLSGAYSYVRFYIKTTLKQVATDVKLLLAI